MRAYDGQLSLYFSDEGLPRGYSAVGTATTEAVEDSEIQKSLAKGLHSLDADIEARHRMERERGESSPDCDPTALAVLSSATLHSIAIWACVGVPRGELMEIARMAVSVICGESAATG
jgi:hypothetical protein